MGSGGYRVLEQKLIDEQMKEFIERQSSQGETGGEADAQLAEFEPQPIERHVLWKQGRRKRDGSYTSEPARIVSEKIVSIYLNLLVHVIILD